MTWKYSITLSSFKDVEPLEKSLEKLKKCGIKVVEISGEPDLISIKDVLELCNSYGIKVLGVTGMWGLGASEPNRVLLTTEKNVFDQTENYIKKCIRMCRKLDGHLFNVCVFDDSSSAKLDGNHRVYSDINKRKSLSNLVRTFKSLSIFANDYGVNLLIEPLNRYSTPNCTTADDAIYLAKIVDNENVGILLDTFHMNIEEDSIEKSILKSDSLLRHIHISDNNRKMPGFGHIDFHDVLSSLRKIRYNGFLSFEPYIPNKYYENDLLHGINTLETSS